MSQPSEGDALLGEESRDRLGWTATGAILLLGLALILGLVVFYVREVPNCVGCIAAFFNPLVQWIIIGMVGIIILTCVIVLLRWLFYTRKDMSM